MFINVVMAHETFYQSQTESLLFLASIGDDKTLVRLLLNRCDFNAMGIVCFGKHEKVLIFVLVT